MTGYEYRRDADRGEPQPVPGCTVCADWARMRERHRSVGNLSGVTDCNVLIRRHRGPDLHSAGPVVGPA